VVDNDNYFINTRVRIGTVAHMCICIF